MFTENLRFFGQILHPQWPKKWARKRPWSFRG
jgi:hypothetical protein